MTQMPFGGLPMFLAPGGRGKPPKHSNTSPIAAGVRASSDNVGYRGPMSALTTYTPGGSPPTGWAWDGTALISSTANAVLDHAFINGGCVVDNDGGSTISSCYVVCANDNLLGISLQGDTLGFMTVTDSTVIGSPTGTRQGNGISSDDGLIARRCHVSGTGDGIHFTCKDGTLISQCYVGPLRFDDEEQHCDGMQQFMDTANGAFTVEHTYVSRTVSTGGSPMSAGLTMGPSVDTPPITYTPTLNNNYFQSGLDHVRFNFMCRNAIVTNNDFGPIYPSEVGLHDFGDAGSNTYVTWSNNRDSSGNLIAAP